jgi:hypothetical protein
MLGERSSDYVTWQRANIKQIGAEVDALMYIFTVIQDLETPDRAWPESRGKRELGVP